jgi:hypothetical protein
MQLPLPVAPGRPGTTGPLAVRVTRVCPGSRHPRPRSGSRAHPIARVCTRAIGLIASWPHKWRHCGRMRHPIMSCIPNNRRTPGQSFERRDKDSTGKEFEGRPASLTHLHRRPLGFNFPSRRLPRKMRSPTPAVFSAFECQSVAGPPALQICFSASKLVSKPHQGPAPPSPARSYATN